MSYHIAFEIAFFKNKRGFDHQITDKMKRTPQIFDIIQKTLEQMTNLQSSKVEFKFQHGESKTEKNVRRAVSAARKNRIG